jgi:hypothetical protein
MFAYCNNNPIDRKDSSGYDYDSTTIRKGLLYSEVSHTFGGVRKRYYNSGCVWLDNIRKEIASITERLEEADSMEDYVAIGITIIDYEIIANSAAAYKLPKGIKRMQNGLGFILLPMPTMIDEVWGAIQIAWGFASTVTGIGELFDWDGD